MDQNAAIDADLVVSPTGDDANPGTFDEPLRTLAGARNRLRELKHIEPQDWTVLIRGGLYFLEETLVFGLEDTAPPGHQILFAAYPNDTPVVSSFVPVLNWSLVEALPVGFSAEARGQIWEADLPEGLDRIHSLYDAQGLLPCARSTLFAVHAMPLAKRAGVGAVDGTLTSFEFPGHVLQNWDNVTDMEIYQRSEDGSVNLLPLASVDEARGAARTAVPCTAPFGPLHGKAATAVENAPAYLTEPGEWIVNTLTRKIYLWPRNSERPERIMAPRLRELIRVEGAVDADDASDQPVEGIVFSGIAFTGADRCAWSDENSGIQHDVAMCDEANALLSFRGAERCAVDDCTFTRSAGDAIRFDLHIQECRVQGCEIRQMGQGGILFMGYGPGTKDVNRRNAVLNCRIHHCGEILEQSPGIMLYQSGTNRLANNEIHDLPRQGICLTGAPLQAYAQRGNRSCECAHAIRWDEVPTAPTSWASVVPFTHTRNNVVEYNRVCRCMQRLSGGAALSVSACGIGNILQRNFVHDIFGGQGEHLAGCFSTGDFQKGTMICENVIARSNAAAYEHKGENAFVNNIVLDVAPSQFVSCHGEPGGFGASVFERNIFIDLRGDAQFYKDAEGIKALAEATVDWNVYWRIGTEATGPEVGRDLEMLRAIGHDRNSSQDDPLLVDWEHDDFRLKPESFAHQLGVVSLDVRRVGLQQD